MQKRRIVLITAKNGEEEMHAILIMLGLVLGVQTALAGSLPAPQLKPGRFVYTIPDDFDPPLIGRESLEDIQRVLSTVLRHPYYVVIVDHFDGSGDEQIAEALNGLAEDWKRHPEFDASISSIFLLVYGQEYRHGLLAGTRWKSEFGLEGDALRPYLQHFEAATTGVFNNPLSGIKITALEFDLYLCKQKLRIVEEKLRTLDFEEAEEYQKIATERVSSLENRMKIAKYIIIVATIGLVFSAFTWVRLRRKQRSLTRKSS